KGIQNKGYVHDYAPPIGYFAPGDSFVQFRPRYRVPSDRDARGCPVNPRSGAMALQLFFLGRCSAGAPRDKDDEYNQQRENQRVGDDIDDCAPDRYLLRSGLLRSGVEYG